MFVIDSYIVRYGQGKGVFAIVLDYRRIVSLFLLASLVRQPACCP